MVKQGRFIWNYDLASNGELSVAVRENIEGNIVLYQSAQD